MEEEQSEPEEDVKEGAEEKVIFIGDLNKYVDINEDIPITTASNLREHESMEIIKTTINMLHEQIEFLKEDIREKNLLIKILNYRDANDGAKISMHLVENLSVVETRSSTSSNLYETDNTNDSNYRSKCNNTDYITRSNYTSEIDQKTAYIPYVRFLRIIVH